MRRREVLLSALLAGAAGRAAAQQGGRTPVVGVLIGLSSAPGAVGQARLAGLRQGLAELGYQPGHNLVLEPRWLEGRPDRLADVARELVELQPDVIVTHGEANINALRRETTTVPIVVAITGDLVSVGHAESLARPQRHRSDRHLARAQRQAAAAGHRAAARRTAHRHPVEC